MNMLTMLSISSATLNLVVKGGLINWYHQPNDA